MSDTRRTCASSWLTSRLLVLSRRTSWSDDANSFVTYGELGTPHQPACAATRCHELLAVRVTEWWAAGYSRQRDAQGKVHAIVAGHGSPPRAMYKLVWYSTERENLSTLTVPRMGWGAAVPGQAGCVWTRDSERCQLR